MRKDFKDFVRQCGLCQANKEHNTLPPSDTQTLPFPSEIFSTYAIDFMCPFTKLKVQDSVLVVVDRAVGFSCLTQHWLQQRQYKLLSYSGTISLRLMEYLPSLSVMLTHHSPLSSGSRHLGPWGTNTLWPRPAIIKPMGRLNERSWRSKLPQETSPTSAKPIGSPTSMKWRHMVTMTILILSTCPYTKPCIDETTPSWTLTESTLPWFLHLMIITTDTRK